MLSEPMRQFEREMRKTMRQFQENDDILDKCLKCTKLSADCDESCANFRKLMEM